MYTRDNADAGWTGSSSRLACHAASVLDLVWGQGFRSVQVAIITGSGQGVGAAAAKLFAQHGAKVVVTDIDGSKSEQVLLLRSWGSTLACMLRDRVIECCIQVASEIREAGGEAISVPGDVTAEDFAPTIVKATMEKYGALHILINNAGQLLSLLMHYIWAYW